MRAIKFDMDGVLVRFGELAEKLLNEDGYKIVRDGNFHWQIDPPLSNNKVWRYFKQAYTYHTEIEAHDGAVELLRYLWHMTDEPIHIITARPSEYTTETQLTLERLFDVPFLLGMTQHDVTGRDKGSKHLYLSPGDFFVEDRRRTVLQLESVGVKSFLIRREYNKIDEEAHPLIECIDSLDELIPMLPFILGT